MAECIIGGLGGGKKIACGNGMTMSAGAWVTFDISSYGFSAAPTVVASISSSSSAVISAKATQTTVYVCTPNGVGYDFNWIAVGD